MNADATAEKRPAWAAIRKKNAYDSRFTHENQSGIEVVVVLLVEVSVIFVRLSAELFVEVCTRILFLLSENRFEGSGQGVA